MRSVRPRVARVQHSERGQTCERTKAPGRASTCYKYFVSINQIVLLPNFFYEIYWNKSKLDNRSWDTNCSQRPRRSRSSPPSNAAHPANQTSAGGNAPSPSSKSTKQPPPITSWSRSTTPLKSL
ncbi:hypothetical protein K1T71_012042 [Dendrolimus kikuchii]|uniref:Uncharacterized protein n=1 Tax=Dendrolimus kikuchii TaxID=765133 RepID=A0ACC1CKE8_9NEOP|nr:hypothetical protein K1T71_012042 [Dendrolimus kikuchii]